MHAVGGIGECRFGCFAVAIAEVVDQVARHGLVQLHGVRRARLRGRDDDRQVFVFDHDLFAGIVRDRLGLRDDQRHRLTNKPHAVARQRRPLRRQKLEAVQSGTGILRGDWAIPCRIDIGAGQHRDYARQVESRLRIDRDDAGMRLVRAQEGAVGLVRQSPIGRKASGTCYKPFVLTPSLEVMAHRSSSPLRNLSIGISVRRNARIGNLIKHVIDGLKRRRHIRHSHRLFQIDFDRPANGHHRHIVHAALERVFGAVADPLHHQKHP